MADKDLDELAKGFKAATDAAEKLTSVERKLAGASDDLAGALGNVVSQAHRGFEKIAALEAKITALTNAAAPLKSALSGVNDQMAAWASLAKDGAKSGDAHIKALKEAEQAANGAAKQIDALGKAQKGSGASTKLSADEAKKLGGTLKSAFDGLASGTDPFKVFLEQGPAIADVLGKAAQDGIGLKGVLLGLGEAALPLAGVGMAAAAIAAPFALGAAEINKANGDIVEGLGLTQEELAKVTHKTVTMGDVFQATLNVIGKHITDGPVGAALSGLGAAVQDALKNLVMSVVDRVADLVGFWVAAYDTIVKNWRNLPVALGAVFVGAVNLGIRQVERLINGGLGALNVFIGAANKIPGIKLELFKPIDIPEMKMVGGAAAQAVYAGFERKQTEVRSNLKRVVGGVWKEVSAEAVDLVKKDALKQAKSGFPKGGHVSNVSGRSTASNYSSSNYSEVSNVTVGVGDTSTSAGASTAREEDLVPYKPADPGLLKTIPQIDKQNFLLSDMIDHFEKLTKLAPALGDSLEKAFGGPGKALSGVISAAATLGKKLGEISLQENDPKNAGKAVEFARERVNATVSGFAEMSIAAQGFFDKNSSGYAALQSVEKAYRAWQFAQQVQAMATEAADTVRSISNSIAKGTASTAAGAAKMFEMLGPFAFPAVAAMVALLAGFGLSGGGGGGAVPGVDDMKNRQAIQGSGSVLGDSKGKSESLEKALTHAQAYENKDLEYGNAMVRSLKSIDDQIGAVASALAKSFGAGGMLSTEGLALGKTGTAASLSNLGFGKSTTRTLQDQGLQFDATTLGAIVGGGGLSGSTYQQVLENTKKKAFGITTSNKSKIITETGALDPDFLVQVAGLIALLGKGVGDAAKAIGSTDFEALLTNFKVDLGKLSFKDMTGTQIEEALNAIFGKLGDDMAKTAAPAIATVQKVGEGAFETLIRVARQYEVIDTTLKSVGMEFKAVGVSSLAARERLVNLVGGLDNLTEQTAFFGEHFLTDEERLKPVKDSVKDRLTELKLPTNMTREGFKDLVLGQDVKTEDGAKLYAALLALAPAFDKVATAAEAAKAAAEAAKAAVDDKRSSLQDQIDDLTLSPTAKLAKSRDAERKAVEDLDKSLVPLLKNLWNLQDAADAAKLATEQSGKYADLLEAQGRTAEATQRRRELALAAIDDPVQRGYQTQIWAAQDAAEKVSAARDALSQAYESQKTIFEGTRDAFKALSESLKAFSASLSDTINGTDLATRYWTTRDAFQTTAAQARLGDENAMRRLQAQGEAFTSAARDRATSTIDYLRDVALVRGAVDDAADTADRQVSIAEEQLRALDASVSGLIRVEAGVGSVKDAIVALQAALTEAKTAGVASVGGMTTGAAPANSFDSTLSSLTWEGKRIAYNDPHYQEALIASLNAQAAKSAEQVAAEQAAALAEGQKWLESVWGVGVDPWAGLVKHPGLPGFASGGVFTNGVVSQPTAFDMGQMGEAGPEAIMPLTRTASGALGVRASGGSSGGDESLINELRRLREEMADLRQTNARIANSNDKMERTLTNVTEGGRAMQTSQAAA